MHTPRLYYPHRLEKGRPVILDARTSHRVLTVLRLTPGDTVILFDGETGEFIGRLSGIQNKQAQIQIDEHRPCQTESPVFIELGQGISRGEKMDFVIQKSVELGVHAITPLFTERCGVKLTGPRLESRIAHWQGIIISACEQSGRCKIPTLSTPMSLNDWLETPRSGQSFVCDPQAETRIRNFAEKAQQISVLLGPEGGLSDNEILLAKNRGFVGLSLGPRTLRTETATISALTLLQSNFGDV